MALARETPAVNLAYESVATSPLDSYATVTDSRQIQLMRPNLNREAHAANTTCFVLLERA